MTNPGDMKDEFDPDTHTHTPTKRHAYEEQTPENLSQVM